MDSSQRVLDFSLTWALQAALLAGLTVACIVLAMTLRRPTMSLLAVSLAAYSVATAAVWLAVSAELLGLGPVAADYLAAVSLPLSPVLVGLLLLHLVRLLAGRTTRPSPHAGATFGIVAGVLALSVLLADRTTHLTIAPVLLIGALGSISAVAFYGVLAILAYRWRRAATTHRDALGFMCAALIALALRSASNILVAVLGLVRGARPDFDALATIIQVFLLVLAGVLLIVAVLDEERTNIRHTADQLWIAEGVAARSDRLESLGRMAGAVAHDFNNLLSVIGMSAENARDADRVTATADLGEIIDSSRRGQELTAQLLSFASQTPKEVSRFDGGQQLTKMSGMLQRIVGKSHRLTTSTAPLPLMLAMDITQFEQVVMNLVVNARDATPQGGAIAVSVDVLPEADGRTFARVSVSDNGSGITAEVLEQIFEPFFSTKSAGEGTGLGLATCQGIVRRAGGRIEVSTVVGKGTRFDVLLPRVA